MKYRPDIDGLRAVAVLAVLLFHAGVTGFSGGFVGVDVFFVISGYVITARLLEDLGGSSFSILDFYERRVRRIFPALLFVFVIAWLASFFLLLPPEMSDFSESLAASGLFASNFYFWRSSGYFDAASTLRPLLHTWSLALEEQFYVFMPIAMYIGHKFLKSQWRMLILPAAAASFALSVAVTGPASGANFYLLPTRAWELLLGSLLILTPLPPLPDRVSQIGAAAGLTMIAYSIFLFDDATPFPGLNALYPCVGTALLIYTGIDRSTMIGRALSVPPLIWVGLISYSLYLIHWPAIVMSRHYLVRDPQGFELLAVIFVSFALAAFCYVFIESPFRKPRAETSRERVLTLAVGSLAATFAVGAVGFSLNGFPSRFPDFHQQHITGLEEWQIGVCFFNPAHPASQWDADQCTITKGKNQNLLLWGDSFAAHYVPGILRNKDRIPANVIQYTFGACPPILSYFSYKIPRCAQFNARALDLIKDYNIKTVVLSARWDRIARRSNVDLHDTVARIRALGANVIIIGQSPEFAIDVQSLAYRLRQVPADQGVSSWTISNLDLGTNERLRMQADDAEVIEPIKQLCKENTCPYLRDGNFLFTDDGHFSTEGSDYAVKKYFPTLLRPAKELDSRM